VSFGDSVKPVIAGNTSLQIKMSGKYTGTTISDEAAGFVRSSQITQRFGGKMTFRGKKATPPMTMRMYMLMTNTTTTKNLN
jgi:hypothetical protein